MAGQRQLPSNAQRPADRRLDPAKHDELACVPSRGAGGIAAHRDGHAEGPRHPAGDIEREAAQLAALDPPDPQPELPAARATASWLRPKPIRVDRSSRPIVSECSRASARPRSIGPWRVGIEKGCDPPLNRHSTAARGPLGGVRCAPLASLDPASRSLAAYGPDPASNGFPSGRAGASAAQFTRPAGGGRLSG